MREAGLRLIDPAGSTVIRRSALNRSGLAGALSLIVAAFLAFGAAPAAAELAHTTVTGEYGKEGPAAGGLEGGCYVAFQSAEQRLYLMGGGKIWGLHRTGVGAVTPLGSPFPLSVTRGDCGDPAFTVDQSNGRIYQVPSSPYEINAFSPSGSPVSGFPIGLSGETCGVATTNTQEVWGGDYSAAAVQKFSSSGGSTGTIPLGYSLCKIAVDNSNNDLYAIAYSGGLITQYTAASSYNAGLTFPGVSGSVQLAINGARHRLYVPSGEKVVAYDTTTGDVAETIDFGGYTSGVAVDEASDTLYIADQNHNVIKEMPAAVVPKATTGEPTGNTSVSGIADPDGGGDVVECFFQWTKNDGTWTGPETGQSSCDQAPPYSSPTNVSATLSGLEGETLYYYRLVVGNANVGGRNFGAPKTIEPHNVKGLFTEPATAVTRTSAQMNASFEGNGEPTEYKFEWGINSYEFSTPMTPVGSPTYPPKTFLSHTPTNLLPDKTYHFRVVALNGLGLSRGQDRTFKTLPAVQDLVTEDAAPVGKNSATLHASYTGDGTETKWWFEWGKTESYGQITPVVNAGSPSGHVDLPAVLQGPDPATKLAPDTVYHFRIVAENGLGKTVGLDKSFKTPPAVSGVVTGTADPVGQESVTLNGEYLGDGEATKYWFEYGLTTKYGKTSEVGDADSSAGPQQLKAAITDYEGYETYHYRLVVENGYGKTYGADMTFIADPAPLPDIVSSSVANVKPTAATFDAEIDPNRWMTVYSFEYGPSADYGSATETSTSIGADNEPHPVSSTVNDLVPGTLYHFRVVAINYSGTTYGPDQVFFTPDAPRVETIAVTAVTRTTAYLESLVSPNAGNTTVRFEYGTTVGYGSSSASTAIAPDTAGHRVTADLSGLEPGTTYHVRAVASNQYGTISGPDQTFATAPPEKVAPSSSTLRCKRGFVKRRGKCVKRRKHHSKRRRHATQRNG